MDRRELLALLVFGAVYLVILGGERAPRRLDRPAAALIGAVLMVVGGVVSREQALAAIHFPTLALLFGMMVLIHHATVAGIVDRLAAAVVRRSRTPRQLLAAVGLAAGLSSALFVNDTVCLLFTPLVLGVVRRTGLPPGPYLIAVATGANVGSTMTVTGNPQNMLVAQLGGFTFGSFALYLTPVGLLGLGLNALVLDVLHGRRLPAVRLLLTDTDLPPLDRKLAVKTLAVSGVLLVAFLVGAPMDLAALSAAALLLVLANRRPEETFAAIDWSLLLFFGGLFVVTHAVTQVAGPELIGRWTSLVSHGTELSPMLALAGVSVVGSNLLSNVPFVMLAGNALGGSQSGSMVWLLLASSATLAGNLTLAGSVANLIVAERARGAYRIGFREFLRVGVPSTLVTVFCGTVLLWALLRLLPR